MLLARRFAASFVRRLSPERDQLSGAGLLAREGEWAEAFCLGATGSRAQACQVLQGDLAASAVTNAALQKLVEDATIFAARQDLSAAEARLLVGNATYLAERSGPLCRTATDTAAGARYSIQQLLAAGHEDTTRVILVTDAKVCRSIMAHYRADSSAIPGVFGGFVFQTDSGFVLYLPSRTGTYVVFNPQYRIVGRIGEPE